MDAGGQLGQVHHSRSPSSTARLALSPRRPPATVRGGAGPQDDQQAGPSAQPDQPGAERILPGDPDGRNRARPPGSGPAGGCGQTQPGRGGQPVSPTSPPASAIGLHQRERRSIELTATGRPERRPLASHRSPSPRTSAIPEVYSRFVRGPPPTSRPQAERRSRRYRRQRKGGEERREGEGRWRDMGRGERGEGRGD